MGAGFTIRQPKHGYHDRVRSQTLAWAMGKPYHNKIDDECCPDFSCCQPDLLEKDQGKRWQYYHDHHGPWSDELRAINTTLRSTENG